MPVHAFVTNTKNSMPHGPTALFNNRQFALTEPYLEQFRRAGPLDHQRLVLFALGQTEAEELLKQLAAKDESYPGLHRTLSFSRPIAEENS